MYAGTCQIMLTIIDAIDTTVSDTAMHPEE